jgi:hypothetical protein
MCCGSEAGSYLRLIDCCINELKAQGPSRTCNESKKDEEKKKEGVSSSSSSSSSSVNYVSIPVNRSEFI